MTMEPQLDYSMTYQPQDMLYQQHSNYPLQYHLYASHAPSKPLPYQRTVDDFFISSSLREDLQKKNEATVQTLPVSNLPDYVHVYHSLVPLDTSLAQSNRVFGYSSWAYKSFSNADGNTYCLRRIEGYRLSNEKAISAVQLWKRISSPGIVHLEEAFTSRVFGDNSLIFIFDYFPLSQTLFDLHFGPNALHSNGANGQPVAETTLWSYITQIVSALKTIHDAQLACRVVDPTKILVTDKGRLRLNCCGIADVLNYGDGRQLGDLQQEDIKNLAGLITILACNSVSATKNMENSLSFIKSVYSQQLVDFLNLLMASRIIGIGEVVENISERFVDSFSQSLAYNDTLQGELSKELENGRLVRLLCKFGFINERPEFEHDNAWSDSGDRYLIKLFRDYVFHQVDEVGNPVLDLGHVLRSLNKLDAGIEENVMLVSRDQQSCLIVTYRELKNCIEAAIRDLSRSMS